MQESAGARQSWLVASSSETGRKPAHPLAEAVSCLRESRVRFAVCQRDFEAPHRRRRLDLLVGPDEVDVALAAVRRPGFREMRAAGEVSTHILLSYENDQLYTIAVHTRFEVAGLEYLNASLAFSRRDVQGPWPRLTAEDRFLHLLFSLALQGRRPTQEQRLELLGLRRSHLDAAKLAAQSEAQGLRRPLEKALPALDRLLQEQGRWRRFQLALWGALLRQRNNRRRAWQVWKSRNLQMRFRPVVLAVMGPPGVGKTAFIDRLEEQLAETPLAMGRLSLSCWSGTAAWRRACALLAPVEPSYSRLRRGRRGGNPRLSEEEWRYLREVQPGRLRLLLGSVRQAIQNAVFDTLLQVRIGIKVVRGIWRCRQPLVLVDGWIGDLGYRLSEPAWLQGQRRPPRLLRRLAMPDGILYRSTSHAFAASRNAPLQREQFENVDLGLRRMLRPMQPVEFIGDESPRHVARIFLRHYWAHVLERHNQHA